MHCTPEPPSTPAPCPSLQAISSARGPGPRCPRTPAQARLSLAVTEVLPGQPAPVTAAGREIPSRRCETQASVAFQDKSQSRREKDPTVRTFSGSSAPHVCVALEGDSRRRPFTAVLGLPASRPFCTKASSSPGTRGQWRGSTPSSSSGLLFTERWASALLGRAAWHGKGSERDGPRPAPPPSHQACLGNQRRAEITGK